MIWITELHGKGSNTVCLFWARRHCASFLVSWATLISTNIWWDRNNYAHFTHKRGPWDIKQRAQEHTDSIYLVTLTSHPFSVYYIRDGIIDNILKGWGASKHELFLKGEVWAWTTFKVVWEPKVLGKREDGVRVYASPYLPSPPSFHSEHAGPG